MKYLVFTYGKVKVSTYQTAKMLNLRLYDHDGCKDQRMKMLLRRNEFHYQLKVIPRLKSRLSLSATIHLNLKPLFNCCS